MVLHDSFMMLMWGEECDWVIHREASALLGLVRVLSPGHESNMTAIWALVQLARISPDTTPVCARF